MDNPTPENVNAMLSFLADKRPTRGCQLIDSKEINQLVSDSIPQYAINSISWERIPEGRVVILDDEYYRIGDQYYEAGSGDFKKMDSIQRYQLISGIKDNLTNIS